MMILRFFFLKKPVQLFMMYIVYPFSLSQAIARLGPFFILFLFDILDEVFFFFGMECSFFFFAKNVGVN